MSTGIDTPRGSLKSLAVLVVLVVGGLQALSWWQDEQAASQIKARLGAQRVTMYSTVRCIYCAKARSWLKAHDIPWDECDVEQDHSCQATFEAHGAPGTPLMRIGTQWHLGFDPKWVAETLAAPQSKPKAETSPRP